MITIEEIYDNMRQKEEENKKAAEEKANISGKRESGKHWTPNTIEEYTVPDFNLPASEATAAGQVRYKTLSKILTFVELAQRLRTSEGCTIMPISVTSACNLAIFGGEMTISRAIDKMIEIGILGTHEETYRFNAPFPYDDENRSKQYKYYVDNERKFIEYCKRHNIEKYVPVSKYEFSEEELRTVEKVSKEYREFKIEDVRFSSDLKLVMPYGVKPSEFELFLLWCLHRNYPMFSFYQMKIEEINKKYYKDYPQFELRFEPKFTWGKGKNTKKVVGISIRATNSYDNKPKENREAILKDYGMTLQSDIKSSVPRLTKSLNEGRWVDDVDIYELINQEFEPGAPFDDNRRKAIKYLHMFAYFETHSDVNMGKNVWRRMNKEGVNRDEVYDVMKRLKKAIIKVEGKLYQSEIFYVESCVYAMVVYDLLSAGHKVWLVYDAFYSKGEADQEDFDNMIAYGVRESFREFYNQDFSRWQK